MGKEMEEFGEFWLPADFLSDDFFVEKGTSPVESVVESESVEESISWLSQRMASLGLNPKSSVMATSPQSTLCGIGSWSFSNNGCPESGTSQVSSPPSTPFRPLRRDPALDLLYAAAGQVARLGMNDENNVHHQGFLCKSQKMGPHSIQAAAVIQQQLQAVRFYELKGQQLMKQQWLAARHREEMDSLGLSNSAWPPLQKHHHHQQLGPPHDPVTRPAFLNGARRESKGTGVFLPRRAPAQAEPRKISACSPVPVPARVVQALNLKSDDVSGHPRVPAAHLLDQETMARPARGNSIPAQGQRGPRPAVVSAHDLRLPTEWTY